MQEFGRTCYDKLVYVNFEETPALQNIFSTDFDIERIITVLQIHAQMTIKAENTLIVLDELVRRIQNRILNSYEGDFSKHAPNETVPRIRMVWQSIPLQLPKENKKFVMGS